MYLLAMLRSAWRRFATAFLFCTVLAGLLLIVRRRSPRLEPYNDCDYCGIHVQNGTRRALHASSGDGRA
jgi:hypothetical protein